MAVGQLAQGLQEAGARDDDPHVRGHRLDHDGGDLRARAAEQLRHGVGVVVGRHGRVRCGAGCDTGAPRQAERRHARARLGQ